MKFSTEKASNPLPYDDPMTNVSLRITDDLSIHFDAYWHDDYEQPGEGDRNVETYVAQLKESLDRFVVDRVCSLHPEISEKTRNEMRVALTNALKRHPIP